MSYIRKDFSSISILIVLFLIIATFTLSLFNELAKIIDFWSLENEMTVKSDTPNVN